MSVVSISFIKHFYEHKFEFGYSSKISVPKLQKVVLKACLL